MFAVVFPMFPRASTWLAVKVPGPCYVSPGPPGRPAPRTPGTGEAIENDHRNRGISWNFPLNMVDLSVMYTFYQSSMFPNFYPTKLTWINWCYKMLTTESGMKQVLRSWAAGIPAIHGLPGQPRLFLGLNLSGCCIQSFRRLLAQKSKPMEPRCSHQNNKHQQT